LNPPAILYTLVLLVMVFWSGNYVAGKIALRTIPPLLFVGVRIGMAAILMLPIYAWERRRSRLPWPTRAQIFRFARALQPPASDWLRPRTMERLPAITKLPGKETSGEA